MPRSEVSAVAQALAAEAAIGMGSSAMVAVPSQVEVLLVVVLATSGVEDVANADGMLWADVATLALSINAIDAPASILSLSRNLLALATACLHAAIFAALRVLKRHPYNRSALLRLADGLPLDTLKCP